MQSSIRYQPYKLRSDCKYVQGVWMCLREGCGFRHKRKIPGTTKYCCRACRLGLNMHSDNCWGQGHSIVVNEVARMVEPQRGASSSIVVKEVARVGEPQPEPECSAGFIWPFHLTREFYKWSVVQTISWLVAKYNHNLSEEALTAWHRTSFISQRMIATTPTCATIEIYVYKQSEVPSYLQKDCIVLESRDFSFGKLFAADGRGPYEMDQVTGVRGCVQAVLVTQVAVAKALEEAIIQIETQTGKARKVIIACRGATHRSVGVACLLVWLFYAHALIFPFTRRVRAHLEDIQKK